MTLRESDKIESLTTGCKLNIKSPNVYNGNKAMRGLSLNEKRFDNINKEHKKRV
mgnify:FL=1